MKINDLKKVLLLFVFSINLYGITFGQCDSLTKTKYDKFTQKSEITWIAPLVLKNRSPFHDIQFNIQPNKNTKYDAGIDLNIKNLGRDWLFLITRFSVTFLFDNNSTITVYYDAPLGVETYIKPEESTSIELTVLPWGPPYVTGTQRNDEINRYYELMNSRNITAIRLKGISRTDEIDIDLTVQQQSYFRTIYGCIMRN
jgi:hypothetical protein